MALDVRIERKRTERGALYLNVICLAVGFFVVLLVLNTINSVMPVKYW